MTSKCLICAHYKRDTIEAAIMNGEPPEMLRRTFGMRAATLNDHIRKCMLTRLAEQVAGATGASALFALRAPSMPDADEEADWLKLPAVANDLRTALHRLEGVANRAAIKGTLSLEIQALQTTLRGLEQRATLGGLDKSTAAPAAGQGWSLTICLGNESSPVLINPVPELLPQNALDQF